MISECLVLAWVQKTPLPQPALVPMLEQDAAPPLAASVGSCMHPARAPLRFVVGCVLPTTFSKQPRAWCTRKILIWLKKKEKANQPQVIFASQVCKCRKNSCTLCGTASALLLAGDNYSWHRLARTSRPRDWLLPPGRRRHPAVCSLPSQRWDLLLEGSRQRAG